MAGIEPSGILLNRQVTKALTQEAPAFHRAGLLAELFKVWGAEKGCDGQTALASAMVEEFMAAKPGSIVRQRLMDSWCRLINWHSDDVRVQPIEEMTEEELIGAISSALPRLKLIADTPEPEPSPEPEPPPVPMTPQERANARRREKTLNKSPTLVACAAQVKLLRAPLGLNQVQCAERAGVTGPHMRDFEAGRRWLDPAELDRLAEVLGVTLGNYQGGEFSAGPRQEPEPEN